MREPHRGLLHRFGQELDTHHAPFLLALHEPGFLQHAQVLHEAGQRHAVRMRKLRHAGRALQQLLHDVAARRVRQRPENLVQGAIAGLGHPLPIASGCSIETRFFSVSKNDT